MWVIDDFGQTYDVLANMLAHPELGGVKLGPDLAPSPGDSLALLKPRILQPSRLQIRFIDALDDTKIVGLSFTANPVCGWLLPNRLDNGILVYDAAGILQGELLLTSAAALWLPSPDLAPPQAETTPPLLENPHLTAFLNGLLDKPGSAGLLGDLLTIIQKASWAMAASTPESPQLSALVGFPIAVARIQLLLELAGNPATDQTWSKTGQDDDGGISQITFPVRLGASNLYDDALVGYLTDADASHLATPYGPSANGYATAPVMSAMIGQPLVATALLHPQGRVHAFSGILPPCSAVLPPQDQQAPLDRMEVTFRSGPILTPPTAVTAPLPSYGHGDWSWLQYDSTDTPARTRALTGADASGTLLDLPPILREGWLRLQLVPQPTVLRYSVSPTAVATGTTLIPDTTLTIAAYNESGDRAVCSSIEITLPVGTDQNSLTAAPELIQPSSAQPDSWSFQARGPSQPGVFVASPADPTMPIDKGVTLTFILANLTVNTAPGPVTIEITESANQQQAQVGLRAGKSRSAPVGDVDGRARSCVVTLLRAVQQPGERHRSGGKSAADRVARAVGGEHQPGPSGPEQRYAALRLPRRSRRCRI